MIRIALLLLFASLIPAQHLAAQTRLNAFDDPQAWAMKYFTSVALFTEYGPHALREPNSWELSFEIAQVPYLDRGYRRVGFGGIKEENLNNAPLLARPKLTYWLNEEFSATVSYVPPIELWNVETELLAASLNWTLYNEGPWTVGLRLHGQSLKAEGSFTCEHFDPRIDPANQLWGCLGPSRDTARLKYIGTELSAAYRFDSGFRPYIGVTAQDMDLEFELRSSLFNMPDYRTEITDGTTVAFHTGFTYPLMEDLDFGFQVLYAPLDVMWDGIEAENDSMVNVRAQISYRFKDWRDLFRWRESTNEDEVARRW